MARTTDVTEDPPVTRPPVAPATTLPSQRAAGFGRGFDSLRVRNFRWFWIAYVFSFFAMQMDMLARGWLVYDLTGSGVRLGLVSLGMGLPMLVVAPVAGVLADRFPKRNLIILSQTLAALMTLALALLIATHAVRFWHVMLTSFLFGTAFSFSMPARQSIISELVDRSQVLNAVALGSGAMNLARVAAPAIAGLLVALVSMAGVYFAMVALQALGVAILFLLPRDTRPRGEGAPAKRPMRIQADLLEGFRYVRRTPVLMTLITLAFIPVLFGMPFQMLMPIFAKDVLGVGAAGLGYLLSASGVGAILGSFLIASFGDFRHKGWLLIGAGVGFGVALILFALTTNFGLALWWMAVVGLTSTGYMSMNNTMVQIYAADAMRGRVISMLMMTWGLMPLGALPLGALAERAGAPLAVVVGGAVVAGSIALWAVARPTLRRLR
ncbi:MAG: MFS transporter [Chloroflexi bacterium]|nr:MFS transporter [Chloroflexota bacterium]